MLTQISKLIVFCIISVYFGNNVLAQTVSKTTNSPFSLIDIKSDYTGQVSQIQTVITNNNSKTSNDLPSLTIIERVKENLAQNLNLKKEDITVQTSISKKWYDGCLELGKDDEFCIQVIVEGWQITLEDQENNTWIYHTNNDASIIRLNDKI